MQIDFTNVPEPPLRGIALPQLKLEQALDEHARELGAEIRRGTAAKVGGLLWTRPDQQPPAA